MASQDGNESEKVCGVWCILTYDGSSTDIIINYTMLAINLLITAFVNRHQGVLWWINVLLTAFLFAFQIVLCLVIGCMGISVVWSAQFGYYGVLAVFGKHPITEQKELLCAVLFGVVATLLTWLYYLVTAEAMTTVAHLCAALMGALIGRKILQLAAAQKKQRSAPTHRVAADDPKDD